MGNHEGKFFSHEGHVCTRKCGGDSGEGSESVVCCNGTRVRGVVSVSLYICCGSGYGIRCILRVSCFFVVMCEGSMNGS